MKGDVKGEVVRVDGGEVNDGGRVGTEGGVVDGDDPEVVDAEVVVLGAVSAAEEVLGAEREVDAAAAVAMVPLRSHGFGGEPIVQIGRTSTVQSGVSSPVCVLCKCESEQGELHVDGPR